MSHKTSSERLADVMQRTRHRWQARHREDTLSESPRRTAPPAFTIALSREAGANGSRIARTLGERLAWPVYDRELLEQVAAQMGLRASLLEGVDEKRRGWLQECLEALASTAPVFSESAYVRHLVETLLSLAAHGECVVVGRGAAQILPAASTFRVRLVGPIDERIASIQRRHGMLHNDAAQWVDKTDAERTRFVKDYFHKDPTDPRVYDLVINSSRFTDLECAELIIEGLHRLQDRAPAQLPELVECGTST